MRALAAARTARTGTLAAAQAQCSAAWLTGYCFSLQQRAFGRIFLAANLCDRCNIHSNTSTHQRNSPSKFWFWLHFIFVRNHKGKTVIAYPFHPEIIDQLKCANKNLRSIIKMLEEEDSSLDLMNQLEAIESIISDIKNSASAKLDLLLCKPDIISANWGDLFKCATGNFFLIHATHPANGV